MRLGKSGARITGALLCACLLVACGGDGESSGAARAAVPDAGAISQQEAAPRGAAAAQPVQRRERPLPAFSGSTLDGKRFSVAAALGRRLVIFFFNPENAESRVVAEAIGAIAPLQGEHNFEIVGISTGSDPDTTRAFVRGQPIPYRVVDDSDARIARQLGLRAPLAVLGVDAEGYIVFGFLRFATQAPNAAVLIGSQLRSALRLPDPAETFGPGSRPEAPDFQATTLDGDAPFQLSALRGEPLVLLFFLHTCPHCHEALEALKTQLAALPREHRPTLVGVEISGKRYAVRETLRTRGLDFFPVLFDDDGSIVNAYGVFTGVPDIFLIDREGRIAAHVKGWSAETDGPLMRMRLAKLGGAPVPMLLRQGGYSGNDVCSVCHEQEQQTWLLTSHATAYDTLVRHGADADAACIGCHVVGYGESGGFEISPATASLENVGCESCHGLGGPHVSPGFVAGGEYAPVCQTCHDPTHSLNFEYAAFLPRVSHASNAPILALPAEERQRVLAERGVGRREALLPAQSDHVGSDACRSCHPAEHATWAEGPHARAGITLRGTRRPTDASCLRCHTTGFGRSGGFPSGGALSEHADLARVGCESCHGAGGEHVKPDSRKRGDIVSLGDKCDSCVVLQICGACHDEANDPGFEFAVKAKIDKIRHGTIEAGTGRPLSTRDAPVATSAAPADAADLRRAAARLGEAPATVGNAR